MSFFIDFSSFILPAKLANYLRCLPLTLPPPWQSIVNRLKMRVKHKIFRIKSFFEKKFLPLQAKKKEVIKNE
jgi:hypothetical protein